MKAKRTNNGGFYPIIDSLGINETFVYYSTLLGASKIPIARETGEAARRYLYKKNILNPSSDGKDSPVIDHALKMLAQARDNERAKEMRYLEALQKMFPEEPFLKKESPDYYQLILFFNQALKNNDLLRNHLKAEAKRWTEYMNDYEKIEQAKRDWKNSTLDKNSKEFKDIAAEYHKIRRASVGTSTLRKVGNFEQDLMKRWKKNSSALANIVEDVVVKRFGSSLFKQDGNSIKLDNIRTNLLIKEISTRVYEQIILSDQWTLQKTASQKRNYIQKNFDILVEKMFPNKNDDDILKMLEKNAIENSHINSIIQTYKQNGIYSTKANDILQKLQQNVNETKKLKTQARKLSKRAYELSTNKKANIRSKEFKKWEELNQEYSEENIYKDLAIMTNISVQAYYTSEDRALAELAEKSIGGYAFTQGASHNTKTDVEAGMLTIKIEPKFGEISSALEEKQAKMLEATEQKLRSLRVGASSEDYTENYMKFQAIREIQLNYIAEMQQLLDEEKIKLNQALEFFNIHTSVKDQAGNLYDETGAGFTGGSVGKEDSVLSFLENLFNLYRHSGTTLKETDLTWLRLAALNSGSGLIGSRNKNSLEAYFSMFVSYLMFDDAYNIVEDAFTANSIKSPSKDIHLYVFNAMYVPLSYLLDKSHKELSKLSTQLKTYEARGNEGAARATLQTYSASGNPGNSKTAWYAEANAAEQATKIKVVLMSGFLELLQGMQKAMDNIPTI